MDKELSRVLIQHITDFLPFLNQLPLIHACKTFSKELVVKDLYNISDALRDRLSDGKLKHKIFRGVEKLDAENNVHITKLDFCPNLKFLRATPNQCPIDQKEIMKVDLVYLNASCNTKIKSVNHMTNLRELVATQECGIDDAGISKIYLTKLDVSGNPKITDLNHMTDLTQLWICGKSGVSDKGIEKLNLKDMDVRSTDNDKVTYRVEHKFVSRFFTGELDYLLTDDMDYHAHFKET